MSAQRSRGARARPRTRTHAVRQCRDRRARLELVRGDRPAPSRARRARRGWPRRRRARRCGWRRCRCRAGPPRCRRGRTRTSSTATPSSSATIWASVVSCPCPWQARPKIAVHRAARLHAHGRALGARRDVGAGRDGDGRADAGQLHVRGDARCRRGGRAARAAACSARSAA